MPYPSFKIMAAYTVVALSVAATCIRAHAQGSDPFPPGDGHDEVVKSCTQCHAADIITNSGKSREEWMTTVSTMVGNGASLNEADINKVVDYLAKSFPPK